MASHINNVLRQAITTFTSKPELFDLNLHHLTSLLDKTTAEDVNLDPQFTTKTLWSQPGKAPVSRIDIYEDSNVEMVIFILKPGGQIPLHNHPQMHGLIKVIAGKVKITSYSLNTKNTIAVDRKRELVVPVSLSAELSSSEVIDTGCKTCLLEPDKNNLHEIQSIDGAAAILDILAPPYGTVIPNSGPRLCSYYCVLRRAGPNVFRLQEIETPSCCWTDEFPYTGPELDVPELVI